MAYKTAFYFEFESDNGTAFRLDIKKNNYTGTAKKRNLGRAPVLKLGKNGAINGSSLDIWAECTTDGEFAVLYTSSPYEYLVELRQGSTVIWQGYVSPELYSEPDIAPPYDVNIVATDGLGELKQYTVESDTLSGRMTLHDVFIELLSPARTVSSVRDYIDIGAKPSSGASQIDILDCDVDMGHLEGETYYDALQRLLDSLHATIRIDVDTAVLIRENNAQAKARTSALTSSWWPVGQLSSEIRPAKKRVSLISEDKMRCILDNPDMGYSGAYWSVENHGHLPVWREATGSRGPYFEIYTSQERGSDFQPRELKYGAISQLVTVGSNRAEMELSLRADALLPVVGKNEALSVVIRTDTPTPLYLKKEAYNDRAIYTWTSLFSRIDIPFEKIDNTTFTPLDYSFTFVTNGASRISVSVFPHNEFDTLNVHNFTVAVSHVGLTPVLQSKGLVEILKINNGARGALDDVNICLNGREPEAYGGLAAAMYGTLMNDQSSPIATVYTAEHGRLSLMQTIARDYAMSVALPRLQKKGVLNVPAGQRPPLIGFGDYLLETYSWNLVAAELDMEMVHFPTASLTVESEVIKDLPKDYTSGGSGSSSGGGGGGGGTTDYNALSNKPSIEGVELDGDKSAKELGLQPTLISGENIATINGQDILGKKAITIKVEAPEMLAAPRLKYAQQVVGGPIIRVYHPLCNKDARYEIVLMHYAKRNRAHRPGDRHFTRKGWGQAGALEKQPLVFSSVPESGSGSNHLAIDADVVRSFIIGHYCRLHTVHTRDEMLDTDVESFKAEYTLQDGFYGWPSFTPAVWKGKHRKRFGIALRWLNPDFMDMVDETLPLSDDTQMIGGVPKYLYTEVAPLTVVISNGILGFEM